MNDATVFCCENCKKVFLIKTLYSVVSEKRTEDRWNEKIERFSFPIQRFDNRMYRFLLDRNMCQAKIEMKYKITDVKDKESAYGYPKSLQKYSTIFVKLFEFKGQNDRIHFRWSPRHA